jgi:hypothetical protein
MDSSMFSYSNGTLRPDMPLYQYLRKCYQSWLRYWIWERGNHCIYNLALVNKKQPAKSRSALECRLLPDPPHASCHRLRCNALAPQANLCRQEQRKVISGNSR